MRVFLVGVEYHAPERTCREIKTIYKHRQDAVEEWKRRQDELRREAKTTKNDIPAGEEWDSSRKKYEDVIRNLSLDDPDENMPFPHHQPSERPFVEKWTVQ